MKKISKSVLSFLTGLINYMVYVFLFLHWSDMDSRCCKLTFIAERSVGLAVELQKIELSFCVISIFE